MAPCSAPMAEEDTARTKICPNGRRNSGAVFTALPGLFCMKPSMERCVRCSGTKASSTSTSWEPVASRPITFQLSMIE
ncbi:hypothetical protein D3C84_1167940 [compost metagenome]